MSESNPNSSGSPDIIMCILSYFGIFSLIPYLVKKDDPFIFWHARQGVLLMLVSFGVIVVLGVLSLIPFLGFLATLATALFSIGVIGLSVYCIVQACNGKKWTIPVLGNYLSKIS